jgi:glutathione peroxidase
MTRFLIQTLLSFLLLAGVAVSGTPEADQHEMCSEWADRGECESNPGYMLINCATSCAAMNTQQETTVTSFYDLSANDIQGNPIPFSQFAGKVVVMTNVASYCGYTESHYRGLVQLWEAVKHHPVEILAFPCNQFGQQEPKTPPEILQFATNKGVEFRMMDKIQVNGPQTHPVYQYVKHRTGVKTITWNFATYFVIGPDGSSVDAYSGVEPMALQPIIEVLLLEDETGEEF